MARPGIEKGQVVWAKLGGYPWWPGIVCTKQVDTIQDDGDSARKITVKFIGENSHANLSASKVVDFADYLLQYSKTKKKHLLRCIECAKQFANGDLNVSDLPSINLSLDRQHRVPANPPPPRKQPKVEAKAVRAELPVTWKPVSEPLCASVKAPSSAQPHDVKLPDDDSPDKLIKPHSLPYLRQGVHNQVSLAQRSIVAFLRGPEPSAVQLSSALLPLLQADLPSTLLPCLGRQLKAFLAVVPEAHKNAARLILRVVLSIKNRQLTCTLEDLVGMQVAPVSVPTAPTVPVSKPEVTAAPPVSTPKDDTCSVELSPLAAESSEPGDSVVFPESEEFVADRHKRAKVCLAIYRLLQSNGFAVKEAKSFALRIESRLRRRDPGMGELYATQYKKMIRDMRSLQPEALNCS